MVSLSEKLAALETLSPAQLRSHAEQVFGSIPARYGPDLMRLALGYALQRQGGDRLPAAIEREIAAATRGSGRQTTVASLDVGTQLVREWNGRSHHVQVIDGGFPYRDRRTVRSPASAARLPARDGPARASSV